MADNVVVTAGSYSATVASDDVGGVQYQRIKLALGAADAYDMDLDSGQQTKANSMPVTIASDQGAVSVADLGATSATVSSVGASATSVTVLASNSARRGTTIYNNSVETLYLKFGTTASVSDFTVILYPQQSYNLPSTFAGRLDGIWTAASGAALVTEW